jgi:signal transduction histidine kinase
MQGVEVVTDLANNIPPLPLEPTLMKQVFLNLVINACQAMPDGGRLSIISQIGHGKAASRQGGPQVEVRFQDTGVGISEGDLRKIFTPFFTTKEIGKGTGLGLSVSYRLVQNHGGSIVAESRGKGEGATFSVYLPLTGHRSPEVEPSAGTRKTHGVATKGA